MSNFTPLTDGMDANAVNFNGPLQELSNAIDNRADGSTAMPSPAITSFASSQHDHTDAANGGQIPPGALDDTGASAGDVPTVQSGGGVAWQAFRVVPAGAMMPYAAAVAPSGWLLCDGSAVSRTTYADLFAAIGTSFGSGDGSTTFNLPDMRGRVPGGLDNMGGTSANRVTDAQADSVGGSVGAEDHTLSEGEMPSHTHDMERRGEGSYLSDTRVRAGGSSATTNYATESAGGDQPHNNVQPTLFLSYIIAT